jgi:hypothetical protein
MKSRFTHINDRRISHDTVACLGEMYEMAKRGELYGVAVVGMLKQRKYLTHVTGEAHLNPTFTLGMLSVLQSELTQQVAR